MPSLIVSNISKEFRSDRRVKRVLHDVSFDVPEGSVLCLLGPNGSGKTTLLKTVATLLVPDAGTVKLGALDVHRRNLEARRLIGFASSEDHSFYGRLTVRMNLWFYAQLNGLSRAQWEARLAEVTRQLELTMLDVPFRELSSGQKQRILLARAVLHDPPVLLLDEPHQNLDPKFAVRLRDLLIEEWGNRGKKTILVSTHHLEDAQKISDRWVVISEGRVRYLGSVKRLRDEHPGESLESLFDKLTEGTGT